MTTVSWILNEDDILRSLSDMITWQIYLEKMNKYKGNLCYSNHYWKTLKILDTIFIEFCRVIKDSDFFKSLINDCLGDFHTFQTVQELSETHHDFNLEEFMENLTYKTSNQIEPILKFRNLWLKRLEQYERVKEANAKAVIVRALYNPRTPLGKIHTKYLYDENFT